MASRAERSMSFGAIADDYNRLRPGPAPDAVDWLLPAGCQVAVDLAAGTGLLTRALAGRVPRVVAVEPDERMAAVLRASVAGGTATGGTATGGTEVLPGRGEQIPLPDASADAVFVSSAWQWMDPDPAAREIARVLRDGGRFGLLWTGRDREVDWVRDLDALREPGPDPAQPDGGDTDRDDTDRDDTDRDTDNTSWHRGRTPAGLPDGLFGPAQTASFTYSRTMTIDDVVAMLATYSGLITASPQDAADALDRARAALSRLFPGAEQIDVPVRSRCWRADRTPRS
ncbi:MAG TPA: class I SAM-dependent methyltransferase [Streptosporangiaceae bacterium]|nr:class I SAM-dependent methyltransferase [Streptosporangiaceae bacterium]